MLTKQESRFFLLCWRLGTCKPHKIGEEPKIFRVVASFGLRSINCSDGIEEKNAVRKDVYPVTVFPVMIIWLLL